MAVPITPLEALEFLATLLSYNHMIVLPISERVSLRLFEPLGARPVKGPQVFDLQIAATMLEYGITSIITYNGVDFRNLPGIESIEPA